MRQYFHSLEEFINNYESDIVHFCVANNGGARLAINLAKSCKRHKIPLVFFGQDKESLRKLSKYAITVNNIEDNQYRLDICRGYSNNFEAFGTDGFKKLTWLRYELCKAILNSNRTVIYLDNDIVIRKNYEANILKYLYEEENIDGVFQPEIAEEVCAGFFALNKNSKEKFSKIFSEDFLSKNNYKSFDQDQRFINSIILKKGNKLFNYKKLPIDNYPVGSWWYRNHKKISKKTMLIHYNYIVGDFRKILKMMRHLDYLSYDFHYVIISYVKHILNRVKAELKKIII